MTDFLSPAEPTAVPHLVDLIYDRGIGLGQLLRPAEVGAGYYDLAQVERRVASVEEQEGPQWETLGPVYLLQGTLQTLQWGVTPGTYHAGRVPDADRYRLQGEEHEYTWAELLDTLARGPIAFRGYPIVGAGAEPQLQLTPALEGEVSVESASWVATQRLLLAGPGTQRDGHFYQLYEEVDEQQHPTGTRFIGLRGPAGEWLTSHTATELAAVAGDWQLLLPK